MQMQTLTRTRQTKPIAPHLRKIISSCLCPAALIVMSLNLPIAAAATDEATEGSAEQISINFNSTNNQTSADMADYAVPVYMQHTTTILVSLHVSVFISGLVGNSLVCLSVWRNKSLQTVTNYYIVNLAVADFLVILICLPPTVYWDLTLTWNFGLILCKLVLYLQSTSVSVSVLTLTCISIDRWYAICRPLEFSSTKSRAKITIGLIWLVSMVIASPDVIFLTTRPLYEENGYVYTDCTYSWPEESTKMYQLCIVTLLFITPFVLMTISYAHIVNVLWRNQTITESLQQSYQDEEEQQFYRRKDVSAQMAAATIAKPTGRRAPAEIGRPESKQPATRVQRSRELAREVDCWSNESPPMIGAADGGCEIPHSAYCLPTRPEISASVVGEKSVPIDAASVASKDDDQEVDEDDNVTAPQSSKDKLNRGASVRFGRLTGPARSGSDVANLAAHTRRPHYCGEPKNEQVESISLYARDQASCERSPGRRSSEDVDDEQHDHLVMLTGQRVERAPVNLLTCRPLIPPKALATAEVAESKKHFGSDRNSPQDPNFVNGSAERINSPAPPDVASLGPRALALKMGALVASCCCRSSAAPSVDTSVAAETQKSQLAFDITVHGSGPQEAKGRAGRGQPLTQGRRATWRRHFAMTMDTDAPGKSPASNSDFSVMEASAGRSWLVANGKLSGSCQLTVDGRSGESVRLNQRLRSNRQVSSHGRFCKLVESRKKAAKMLIVIVIMFGLCYLPVHFLNLLRYTIGLPQNDLTTIASLVSHWLCYFNSAVNPLIYNLMSGKFRHEFANLFFCRCFRRRD